MADNKILDSDSLVAIREFVNNKIDEKIAESGGSGGSSSDHKEFLRIKQDIFASLPYLTLYRRFPERTSLFFEKSRCEPPRDFMFTWGSHSSFIIL